MELGVPDPAGSLIEPLGRKIGDGRGEFEVERRALAAGCGRPLEERPSDALAPSGYDYEEVA